MRKDDQTRRCMASAERGATESLMTEVIAFELITCLARVNNFRHNRTYETMWLRQRPEGLPVGIFRMHFQSIEHQQFLYILSGCTYSYLVFALV